MRDKKLPMIQNSLAVLDSDYSITNEDGINFFRAEISNAADLNITMPDAKANEGRVITFFLGDANTSYKINLVQNSDGANIDGADATFTALDADDDWCDMFSTGSEWIIIRQSIS